MSGTRPTTRQQALKELLDRFVSASSESPPVELRKKIESEYWSGVIALVESFVAEDLPKDFEISAEDREYLSFALLDHPAFAQTAEKMRQWAGQKADGEYPVLFMHDALKQAYRDALRLETLAKLRQSLETVDQELADWPDVNLEYIKYRDRLVGEALGSTPQGQHVLRQYSEIDERLEEFKRMERHNQSEGWQTGEERKQWLAVKQYMEQRQTEISRVLDPLSKKAKGIKEELAKCEATLATAEREIKERERELADLENSKNSQIEGSRADARNARQIDVVKDALAKSLEQRKQAQSRAKQLKDENAELLKADGIATAGEAVVVTVDHLLDLRNERRLVEAQIRDEETTMHQTSPADVRGALIHEVGNVRGLLRLAAKYAKCAECSMPLLNNAALIEPQTLVGALKEIELLDPGLFNNASVKRFGKPALFLAPGVGDGVFDADRNRLVIPQHTLKTPLESVALAVVLYRLDTDAGYNDRKLFKSYQEGIKDYAGAASILKLRMNFIRDYLAWVTREARGDDALTRDAREWFEAHVAPRKDDPLLPREFRGLGARQIKSKLDEVERAQASAERSFKAAMLRWLMDPESEEHTKRQVIPLIEEAMRQAPENLDYLYSAGALYKRTRLYQQAIDCFSRYSSGARKSWWTSKAVELCAACR